jgi:uncharacterized glyoxalase superfamily protein PhnB
MAKVKPIPEGYHAVTPYLVVNGAAKAIEFYTKAFGAKEVARMPGPGGKLMHVEVKIGDSYIFLADECPEMGGNPGPKTLGGTPVSIHLYVDNIDAVFKQALAAGAQEKMPPANMFWGDRFAKIADPFGHEWSLATHVEDVPPAEMPKRMEAAMAAMAKGKK